MKSSSAASETKRAYRLGARAEAARAATDRILDSFKTRLRDGWFDEIRLEDVAADAGVSVQTVLRRFGGKEGLLEATTERMAHEVMDRRAVAPGDIETSIRALIHDYELAGDLVMRALAQEDRHPAIRANTEFGRVGHRKWLREVFAPWLDRDAPDVAEARLDALVVATDLYVWKLIRRDMGRPIPALQDLMRRMIRHALEDAPAPSAQAKDGR